LAGEETFGAVFVPAASEATGASMAAAAHSAAARILRGEIDLIVFLPSRSRLKERESN
jgi:hypothetical protein